MPDVILPVLDEVGAIPRVLDLMPDGYRPIVVDNGSVDGSAAVAAACGAVVVSETARGFGAACFAGLLAAEDDVVCFMDCDGSLDPRRLTMVAEPVLAGTSDLVIGERIPDRGAWPAHAQWGNRLLAGIVRRRTGLALRDLGPMRAARREPLLALGIRDRRFGWPLEMVIRASAAGWRISSISVPYHPRVGRSKVTGSAKGVARTMKDSWQVLRA